MARTIILLWFPSTEIGMRAIVLAIVAIGVGLAHPARAEGVAGSDRPIGELLPLFDKNHCGNFKEPADQLFCGDPQLNETAAKMNTAIQERLNRVPDRRHAIEENAQWIRDRNSSCGILGRQAVRSQDINSVKTCLSQESEERIVILDDPNFDCLATNTAAGALICSEPSLAIADKDLGDHVVALIAKLKDDDARDAFVEYGRWIRSRDRKCGLVGKDNVPLEELTSSEDCLADSLGEKTKEVLAAKGDPKRIFGRNLPSPSPDADAVDACVGQIHLANACQNFIRVSRVTAVDSKVTGQDAQVTADVEMVVISPFAACSPIASGCTGTCWDLKSGKAGPATTGNRDSFAVAHRVKIEKSFAFQKIAGGGRCSSAALQPVDRGVALSGH